MRHKLKKRVRLTVYLFMVALAVSGVTAFPIEWELSIAITLLPEHTQIGEWIHFVYSGYVSANEQFPFIAYGTDWLAFAHLMIAILFWGVAKDPVKNIWIIEFGMIASAGIIPLALIAGHYREIPFFWQCIDMSFGVFGIIPLILIHRWTRKLQNHI